MKQLLILVIVSFYMCAANAQAPSANENSLLWKITGKGIAAPAYLYGTIHIIPREDFFLTDSTIAALNQATKVAFEFNLKKEMRLLPQLRMMMRTRMKEDTTLEMLLNERDYAFVKSKIQSRFLPMRFVERMKPMFLSDLSNQNLNKGLKKSTMTSYEMEFLHRAKAQDKKITGLETAKYQIGIFDSIPYTVQAQMLVEELKKDKGESSKEYKRLVKIYKRQDLEMLTRMATNEDNFGGYNAMLLDNRNRNWIPVIEKLIRKDRMFIAVGAAHLVGNKGVIALLRQRGYTVTPVR